MPEGSLVHKGERLPSKFSRCVSLQAKKNPKEVQATKNNPKDDQAIYEVNGRPIGSCKRSSQEGKYPKVQKSSPIIPSIKGAIGKKAEGSCLPPLNKAWKFPSYCPKAIYPHLTIPKSPGSWGIIQVACVSCGSLDTMMG
jgi:hypothetical protein